jgi:hypothetical protein
MFGVALNQARVTKIAFNARHKLMAVGDKWYFSLCVFLALFC